MRSDVCFGTSLIVLYGSTLSWFTVNNPWKPHVLKNEHANKTTQHQRCCCLIYVFLLKVNLVGISRWVPCTKKHLPNLLGAHKNFHHLRQYLGYHTLSSLVLQERMFLNKKKIICFLATKNGVTVIDVMSCYTMILLSVTLLLCYTSRMISTIRLQYTIIITVILLLEEILQCPVPHMLMWEHV